MNSTSSLALSRQARYERVSASELQVGDIITGKLDRGNFPWFVPSSGEPSGSSSITPEHVIVRGVEHQKGSQVLLMVSEHGLRERHFHIPVDVHSSNLVQREIEKS